ncbi:DUF1345 domain-containing protein [Microbacterium sp.]|uniref:DUF1345 domain-containing protein n=1 Tax=Microbacterium sp. TaxID=51671 RepID=UPI003340B59A
MSHVPRKARRRRRRLDSAWSWVLNWGMQIVLAAIGIAFIVGDGSSLLSLTLWCGLGSLYALVTIVYLSMRARGAESRIRDDENPRWFDRIRGAATVILTVIPTAIGVTAALQVILVGAAKNHDLAELLGPDIELGWAVKPIGVWAMLLAWGFLHWGFAQLYMHQRDRMDPVATLDFPDTPKPGLVDFVYFSFTVGTTFAASDVNVRSTRTRWTVTVHSVLGFLMNALIIALSFNTIMNAANG